MSKIKADPNFELKFSKKYLAIILAVALLAGLVFYSRKFLIVATVNGKSIDRLSVLKKLEKQGGKKILDSMITVSLIRQEAKKRKIDVNQKEIDGEMEKIEKSVTSQGSTLEQALQNQGMTKDDLLEEIRTQVMLQKMVGDDMKITDKEIDDFINANKNQQGFNPETPRGQIADQLKQQKIQKKIQSLVTDLKTKAKIVYFTNY